MIYVNRMADLDAVTGSRDDQVQRQRQDLCGPRRNSELNTKLIFRTLNNTSPVADNAISGKVVEIEKAGGSFTDIRDLDSGKRGRKVFENGDLDAGVWSTGLRQGLIHDISSVGELVERMVREAEEIIETSSPT